MKRIGRKMSLNKRLALITISVFIPMVILMSYLLSTLIKTTNAYDKITESVAYANRYTTDFKERMDYSMYLAVIAGKSLEELGEEERTVNGVLTVNPYDYIEELKIACDEMAKIATVDGNSSKIRRVKKSLDNLKTCVREIDYNIQETGYYDTNVELLNKNIYTFTTIIQQSIQDYVYTETENFVKVRSELSKNNESAIRLCVCAFCAVICFSFTLSTLTSRSISNPIKKLCRMAEKVAIGDFTSRVDEKGRDEIAVLANSFNNMTQQIGELVEDIKMEQENLHITETKLLQAQINPHFLYNTLDTIVWLAEEKQTKEVVAMVTSLSDFFRSTLSEGRDFVTIREEEAHIRSYLEIQQFRYSDILDYEISMEQSIYNYKIPKLTLQPLVENAIYHGIKNKRGKGLIRILGEQKGDKLYFRVIDNGIGMDEEELTQIRKKMMGYQENNTVGFGLANVNQRLQYYYGKEYGVFFESEKGKGTEATVILKAEIIQTFSKENKLL